MAHDDGQTIKVTGRFLDSKATGVYTGSILWGDNVFSSIVGFAGVTKLLVDLNDAILKNEGGTFASNTSNITDLASGGAGRTLTITLTEDRTNFANLSSAVAANSAILGTIELFESQTEGQTIFPNSEITLVATIPSILGLDDKPIIALNKLKSYKDILEIKSLRNVKLDTMADVDSGIFRILNDELEALVDINSVKFIGNVKLSTIPDNSTTKLQTVITSPPPANLDFIRDIDSFSVASGTENPGEAELMQDITLLKAEILEIIEESDPDFDLTGVKIRYQVVSDVSGGTVDSPNQLEDGYALWTVGIGAPISGALDLTAAGVNTNQVNGVKEPNVQLELERLNGYIEITDKITPGGGLDIKNIGVSAGEYEIFCDTTSETIGIFNTNPFTEIVDPTNDFSQVTRANLNGSIQTDPRVRFKNITKVGVSRDIAYTAFLTISKNFDYAHISGSSKNITAQGSAVVFWMEKIDLTAGGVVWMGEDDVFSPVIFTGRLFLKKVVVLDDLPVAAV